MMIVEMGSAQALSRGLLPPPSSSSSSSLPTRRTLFPSTSTFCHLPFFFSSSSSSSVSFRHSLPPVRSSPVPPNHDSPIPDMELYLNQLSLEYDSVWDTKPSWCQPWTIVLTGLSAILGSWLASHSVLLTALVTSVIGVWWLIFLYSYPRAYSEMIAERRKRVSQGDEDTFGTQRLVK